MVAGGTVEGNLNIANSTHAFRKLVDDWIPLLGESLQIVVLDD